MNAAAATYLLRPPAGTIHADAAVYWRADTVAAPCSSSRVGPRCPWGPMLVEGQGLGASRCTKPEGPYPVMGKKT
jgi:hypothetical protein